MQTLQGIVVLVTGAGDGMGKQIALRLGREGARLALLGRTERKLTDTLAAMPKDGSRLYVCDVRDAEALRRTAERIIEEFGQVDVLINNAGILHPAVVLDELEEEAVRDTLGVNLMAPMLLTRLLLPHMRTRPEAAIINIVSKQALLVSQGHAAYAASKWGLRGFTEALKADLKGTHIRVSGVYPAGTRTNLFEGLEGHRSKEQYTDPKDIAEAVYFILTRKGNMRVTDMIIDHP